MTLWGQVRVRINLLERLKQYRIKTGLPASAVVEMAIVQYFDEVDNVEPIWIRQLRENVELVDKLRHILKERPDDPEH